MFAALFAPFATQITLQPFDLCHGGFPAALRDCDAWITTGSRASVYDDVAWIQELKAFVREAQRTETPFVGICFGHQMLAEALGGSVAKADQGWGVGVQAMTICHNENWMQPPQSVCRLQYMHQDQVQRLPDDSLILGQSDHCPAAMLRVGATLLGVQAHPEFTKPYSAALLHDRAARIGQHRTQAGLASLLTDSDEKLMTGWIVEFLRQFR